MSTHYKFLIIILAAFSPTTCLGQLGGGNLDAPAIENFILTTGTEPGLVHTEGADFDITTHAMGGHDAVFELSSGVTTLTDTFPILTSASGTLDVGDIMTVGTKSGTATLSAVEDPSGPLSTAVQLDTTTVLPPAAARGDTVEIDRILAEKTNSTPDWYRIRSRHYVENFGIGDIKTKIFINGVNHLGASWTTEGGESVAWSADIEFTAADIAPKVDAGGKYYDVVFEIFEGGVATDKKDSAKVYVD